MKKTYEKTAVSSSLIQPCFFLLKLACCYARFRLCRDTTSWVQKFLQQSVLQWQSSFCPTTKLLMGGSIGSEEELLGVVWVATNFVFLRRKVWYHYGLFLLDSCVENGALYFAHIHTYTLFRLACIDMQDLFSLSSSSTLLLYIYILCTFNV